MKLCTKCKTAPRKYNTLCIGCRSSYVNGWRKTHSSYWNSYLKKTYEITIGEYNTLLDQQNGVCAICEFPPKTRRLAVDHDHHTGEIRGLLCPQCNRGLPWFRDNPAWLESAARYLRRGLSS